MTKVLCTIKNCHYWGEGNTCHAEEILITSNQNARFGKNNVATHKAHLPIHTACATFETDEKEELPWTPLNYDEPLRTKPLEEEPLPEDEKPKK